MTQKLSLAPGITSQIINNDSADGPNKRILKRSLQIIISLLRQPLISRKAQKEGPYDVIIVPGFPFDEEKGIPVILKLRIKWAHHLISEGVAKNVIFSGSAVYTPYVESEIMALYAKELGIPIDQIYCESDAEHSVENIVYSIRLAEALGLKKIAVATGPFQSAFLNPYVKDHSLPVSFIPITVNFSGKATRMHSPEIDPTSAYADNFVSLKDRESREERFQGTLGNKITD